MLVEAWGLPGENLLVLAEFWKSGLKAVNWVFAGIEL